MDTNHSPPLLSYLILSSLALSGFLLLHKWQGLNDPRSVIEVKCLPLPKQLSPVAKPSLYDGEEANRWGTGSGEVRTAKWKGVREAFRAGELKVGNWDLGCRSAVNSGGQASRALWLALGSMSPWARKWQLTIWEHCHPLKVIKIY